MIFYMLLHLLIMQNINICNICFNLGLYWRIHQMELVSSFVFFAILTALSTYLMAMAYRNTKFVLKHKIAVKREDAITREMTQLLADDKMSRKEKDERILWKKNEVSDFEATVFAIFYNNAIFISGVVFCSFWLFRAVSPTFNYVVTIGGMSGLLALLSTSKSS
jgi:translocon-associated protein subunit gamma